jgi:hypothetical protein
MRLAALFCTAGVLFAQADPKPAAQWILSPEPLKQAWAAHWITERKINALIPDLLRVIQSPETSPDADAAKFAALDALIQLNAAVPLRDLEPLLDRFPTDVLILAARSSEDSSAILLKLLDRPHNLEAFSAVGNLLTPKRASGFVKRAMKEFCERATVMVLTPDQERPGVGSAWAGDGLRPPDRQRTEWPETGSYRLADNAGRFPELTPLAAGPRSVLFVRKVDKSYIDHGFDYSSEESGRNSCMRAGEFLAAYLDTSPSELPIHSKETFVLNWTNDRAFEAAVRGFIAEQRRRYAILAGQLAARGFWTVDEASQATLNLRVSASDQREHDRTPLPDVDAWAQEPPP